MHPTITLQIVLLQPPPGVDFGVQQGSGSIYKTIQKQRSASADLVFTFSIIIKGDPIKDVLPKFSGDLVHGPAGGKFIYIDIGTCAGQLDSPWTRRLKVPLTGITWKHVKELAADPSSFLQTRVAGKAKDGGPNCATVKPFEGWHLKK